MKNISVVISVITLFIMSCSKFQNKSEEVYLNGSGVFVLNEGNFTWGNGSLSFYSYDSSKIFNNLFLNCNERPLGDVPNSLLINNNKIYLVINNSGKIEVVDQNSIKSLATIGNLNSPRNIGIVNNVKAYVTSMYSDSVTIIDLLDNSVAGYINLRRTSESVLIYGQKAYISNWIGGNEVMVIDTFNDKVIDSIKVGAEPESMVIDSNNSLWVLCNGGWSGDFFPELIAINTELDKIVMRLTFNSKESSPVSLHIDGEEKVLYYLDNNVYKMNISDNELPTDAFISHGTYHFYKLGINPANNDIFITDALDYQNKGFLLRYDAGGSLITTSEADVIPGNMCFKLEE